MGTVQSWTMEREVIVGADGAIIFYFWRKNRKLLDMDFFYLLIPIGELANNKI